MRFRHVVSAVAAGLLAAPVAPPSASAHNTTLSGTITVGSGGSVTPYVLRRNQCQNTMAEGIHETNGFDAAVVSVNGHLAHKAKLTWVYHATGTHVGSAAYMQPRFLDATCNYIQPAGPAQVATATTQNYTVPARAVWLELIPSGIGSFDWQLVMTHPPAPKPKPKPKPKR